MTDDAPYLFDVTRLIWRRWTHRRPTGVDRVCLAYLRHFGDRSQAVVQHRRFRGVLGICASQNLFALLEEPSDSFRTHFVLSAFRHLHRLGGHGEGRPYLNVGHTGLNSPGFRTWVHQTQVRPIYFVHDLIPITHPRSCRTGEDERHRDRMRTVLETAAGVIGNSRATLDELSQFAGQERLPYPPALAAWLGIDLLPIMEVARIPVPPTFVVLGTIEARKNHKLLLDLWRRLITNLGSQAPRLLIIGQRGWEAEEVFHQLDKDTRLRGHVMEINNCSDQELAQHLASARALLFPSLVEGFGLPLIEALAAGVPAIASDLPVFREICGDVPDYVAPSDIAGWEQAVADYAAPDSVRRDRQLARLKGFAAPTWDAHFKRVDAWLASLA